MDGKVDSASLQFKTELQRPRAYQMAKLFGTDFNWETATSSMTPSMSSGHSLEGLLGTGAVCERILQTGPALSPPSETALQQYAVDIGDRRVMAGVHYPSDNIASWYLAMHMAPFVFRDTRVIEFLRRAIHQSFVRDLLHSSEDPAYEEPLRLLYSVGC